MIVKLLTEHHLEFLSLKGGSAESTPVKMSNCWKSHAAAHIMYLARLVQIFRKTTQISQFDVFISEDRWKNNTTLCQQETNCNHTIQSEENNLDNPNEKVKMTEVIIPQREQL